MTELQLLGWIHGHQAFVLAALSVSLLGLVALVLAVKS